MKSKQYTLSVLTLGCRVNQYESDAITCELQKNGVVLVPFGEKCDASLINTCTVTAESDRKSRQMIRRASHNTKNVIVTGCFAQISPDEAAEVDGVVYVCGNKDKSSLVDVIMKILEGTYVGEKNAVRSFDNNNTCTMTLEKPMRSRSYIKIEDGCANHCSYCIISSARGPVCSKPIENVISEAQTLASKGCREVILTGIETASYGMDFSQKKPYGYALADLVEKVNEIDGIERIGLGSLDPSVMNDYFVDKISKTKKALPHFHLSVQSGSSAVLARMRRKYNRDMLLRAIERMKNKHGSADYRKASPLMKQVLVKTINEDLTDMLPNINVPTLLVWGDMDTATPLSDAKIMEDKIPDAGLVILKNTGHYSFLEDFYTFSRVIDSFLGGK